MSDQFKIAVNTIVVRDGKVLLGLRKNAVGAGTWGLPGGHLENGEGITETAERELLEETGLILKTLEFVCVTSTPEEHAHYIHIDFLVREFEGELQLKEPDRCERWQWFPFNQLPPAEQIFFVHRDILEAFMHGVLVRDHDGTKVSFLSKSTSDGSASVNQGTPIFSNDAKKFKLGLYHHFKGGYYQALGIVHSSEDRNGELVAYRSLENGYTWVRPLTMFIEPVDRDGYTGPRFTYLG